jgi:hypothetical protein
MRDGATLFTAIYTPKDHSKKISLCNVHPTACALWGKPSLKEHRSQRDHDEKNYRLPRRAWTLDE